MPLIFTISFLKYHFFVKQKLLTSVPVFPFHPVCWLNDMRNIALPCPLEKKKLPYQFSHDYLHVLDLLQTKNMEKTELSIFFSTFGKVNVERAQLAISCCLVYKTESAVALLVCKTMSAWLQKHQIRPLKIEQQFWLMELFEKVKVERALSVISCCLVYKTESAVALLVCKTRSAWLHKH